MQEDKETAIEWLIRMLYSPACVGFISGRRVIPHEIIKQALEKEKKQIIDAMEKTAMYVSAASLDKEIGKMNFEDFYNQTYNQNK